MNMLADACSYKTRTGRTLSGFSLLMLAAGLTACVGALPEEEYDEALSEEVRTAADELVDGSVCSPYHLDSLILGLEAEVCILRVSDYLQGKVTIRNNSLQNVWVHLDPRTNISPPTQYSGMIALLPGQAWTEIEGVNDSQWWTYDTTPNTPNSAIANIAYYGSAPGTEYWHNTSRTSAAW